MPIVCLAQSGDLLRASKQFRLWGAFLLIFCVNGVSACRYSVRDVGFAEIRPRGYSLRLPSDSGQGDLLVAARGALLETNIDAISVPGATEITLISPDGRELRIRSDSLEGKPSETLRSIATSPARDRILEDLLSTYATLVVAEGQSVEANRKVREAVEQALVQTRETMTTIPKPVDKPPRIVDIPFEDRQNERVLLWSLGMEPDGVEPEVAVLYGKARRIGATLWNQEITTEKVFETLSVIGLDCECGLDRSWMEGVRIPLRWSPEMEKEAVGVLGFDPESPLAKMEISQILSNNGSSTGSPVGNSEDPLLGYAEKSLDFEKLDLGTEGSIASSGREQAGPQQADPGFGSAATAKAVAALPVEGEAPSRVRPEVPAPVSTRSGGFAGVWGVLGIGAFLILVTGFGILYRGRIGTS